MKGIVLAAGKGSRLAELNLQHKSFAVVQKKHVINFSLDLLIGDDELHPLVQEIVIVVGHNAQVIIDALGDSYRGVPIKYVFQKELKGIAHAVLTAKETINDDFVMCLADEILLNSNLKGMIEEFYGKYANCICGCVIDANDQSGKPIAYEINEDGIITSITEKPKSYPNAIRGIGECIFKKECLDYLLELQPNPIRGELEMGDWIRMIVQNEGNVRYYKLADAYVNINYAKDIDVANELLAEK